MKRNSCIAAVALFVTLGTVELAAVTHTIRNDSDTSVIAELHFKNSSDNSILGLHFNVCESDVRGIASDKSLVSQRGNNCLLDYVQITPHTTEYGAKAIKLNLGKDYRLVVTSGVDTSWEYNGETLVPTSGVDVIGYHDFTKSN